MLLTGDVRNLLPGLLGQDGRLLHDHVPKEERIDKPQYKAYLKMVESNVGDLLGKVQLSLDEVNQKISMTKQKVASQLGAGLKGRAFVSLEQNAEMLRGLTCFYGTTVETFGASWYSTE